MTVVAEKVQFAYEDARAIALLVRAHTEEHGERLQGIVAFGDLVVRGGTGDIDLLEVVEGWKGKRYFEFQSTAALPLRGELRLYLIRPEELLHPEATEPAEDRPWVEGVLQRVRAGFEVVMEQPPGAITSALQPVVPYSTRTTPATGIGHAADALRLLNGG